MTEEASRRFLTIGKHKCLHVPETDSTNALMERILAEENAENSFVVMSDYQAAGKGMLQNTWLSERGKNLLISIYFKNTGLMVDKQFFLSKAISLALYDVVSQFNRSCKANIKWPNDILLNEKKMAGILIKNTLKNTSVTQSIVGIGLNVNQMNFPEEFRATSIRREMGVIHDLFDLLPKFLDAIDFRMKDLIDKKYSKINLDYHNCLYSFKKWAKYEKSGHLFEGRIFEVNDDGRVIIEKKDGSFEKFEVKEISLIQE